MPTDLAKKWTGGDCGLRQSTGNADRTIDLARLRECDLRKDDLTSLGYRASLAGFVTHTANLDSLPAGYLGGIFAIVSQRSTVQTTILAFRIRLNQIRAR